MLQFTNVTKLWLDWNQLTRIPLVFADLTQLGMSPRHVANLSCAPRLHPRFAVELRLEGNPLRRPRIQIIIEEGLAGLKKWCDSEVEVNVGLRNRSTLTAARFLFQFDVLRA